MRGMRARLVLSLSIAMVLAAGCGGDDDGDGGSDGVDAGGGGVDAGAEVLEHDFPSVPLASGEEVTTLCLAWTLGNEETIFVDSVTMNAGPGWHHSNWFYVPEGTFSVDDGLWECGDEFNQFKAATEGGVLFAQSTQATDETQSFGDGAALELPPRSVVTTQIHLLNASDTAIETGVSMRLGAVPEEAVRIRLSPLSFTFQQLAIPPQKRSRFETACDMENALGAPLDISLYYVLPHYHAIADGMNIEILGGDRDGEPIHVTESQIGEPLGATLSPPLSLAGARGIRFSCTYDNPTDRTIGYGNAGRDEMCIFLAFTDSDRAFAGGVLDGEPQLRGTEDGVDVFDGPCLSLAVPR
jgi:Copper type II ascorbate-dependent monooxygenase, C-terminal domain